MKDKEIVSKESKVKDLTVFDYDNTDWPRDFDIRIEVAEQREVLELYQSSIRSIQKGQRY